MSGYLKRIQGYRDVVSDERLGPSFKKHKAVLAPVRNARSSAGKTTAGSAGLSVSRHAGVAVGG